MLMWGNYKNPSQSTSFCKPKTEDLVLVAQINFPCYNFPNGPAERKKAQIHTIIHKPWHVCEE